MILYRTKNFLSLNAADFFCAMYENFLACVIIVEIFLRRSFQHENNFDGR